MDELLKLLEGGYSEENAEAIKAALSKAKEEWESSKDLHSKIDDLSGKLSGDPTPDAPRTSADILENWGDEEE